MIVLGSGGSVLMLIASHQKTLSAGGSDGSTNEGFDLQSKDSMPVGNVGSTERLFCEQLRYCNEAGIAGNTDN